jgi:hypothetical protein
MSVNPWIEHVKKYSKENNVSYACAISEAGKTYVKVNKNDKKQEMIEKQKMNWRMDIRANFTDVLKNDPDKLPSLRLKIKTRNKKYRDYMKEVAPNMYERLTEKIDSNR